MGVDRACAMLQSYFPGHGFDPKGTLEERQSQRVIRLERGTTSKSVYFHLWTFFRNYNLPIRYMHKLDDGWPESAEEQGLLLLVWRRKIRNDI